MKNHFFPLLSILVLIFSISTQCSRSTALHIFPSFPEYHQTSDGIIIDSEMLHKHEQTWTLSRWTINGGDWSQGMALVRDLEDIGAILKEMKKPEAPKRLLLSTTLRVGYTVVLHQLATLSDRLFDFFTKLMKLMESCSCQAFGKTDRDRR